MDSQIAKRLIDQTRLIVEDEASEWNAVEALWQPFADAGDIDAQFHLANFYLDYFDEGPDKDTEMKELLRKAADHGHADATYRLRQQYPEGRERDALLLRAGELGSLEAQRDLGALYATGDWTGPHDAVRGAEWYERAAERGHAEAQYSLGFMYLRGEGVPIDPSKGLEWLRRSAGQGDENAIRLLADVFCDGTFGIPADQTEAQFWCDKYKQTELYELRKQRWGEEGA